MGGKRTGRRVAIGCALVLALAAVGAGVVIWVTARAVRNETLTEPAVRHELPGVDPEGENSGVPVPSFAGPAGAVVLSMKTGQLFVEPAEVGEALQVEASYDAKYYAFEESFEPGAPWAYRMEMRLTGSAFIAGLKEAFGGRQPHVRVLLPPGVPLHLEMRLTRGTSNLDVGGLLLRSADLEFDSGVLELSADKPLPVPPERIRIQGRKGALFLHSFGNASPRELDIDFRMGEAQVDLRGDWFSDSQNHARRRPVRRVAEASPTGGDRGPRDNSSQVARPNGNRPAEADLRGHSWSPGDGQGLRMSDPPSTGVSVVRSSWSVESESAE